MPTQLFHFEATVASWQASWPRCSFSIMFIKHGNCKICRTVLNLAA